MKVFFKIIIVASLISFSHSGWSVKNILILGDSHFLGSFGEYVHNNLHETNRYDIMSIAIGGAGTMHFTMTMRNFCCGYKIRVSCADGQVEQQSEMYILEKSSTSNNRLVGKHFDGQLSNFLKYWMPDLVVVSLGSNNTNAHQQLVDIIREYKEGLPIVWIGPFLRMGSLLRYQQIEKAINSNENIHLVRSDDIVGSDSLASAHFYGYTAKKWANEVTERMDPILTNLFTD